MISSYKQRIYGVKCKVSLFKSCISCVLVAWLVMICLLRCFFWFFNSIHDVLSKTSQLRIANLLLKFYKYIKDNNLCLLGTLSRLLSYLIFMLIKKYHLPCSYMFAHSADNIVSMINFSLYDVLLRKCLKHFCMKCN